MFNNFSANWKRHFKSPFRYVNFSVTLILLAIVMMFFTQFLLFAELRSGFVFTDPLLKMFAPIDVTYYTFAMIYAMVFSAIFVLISKPDELIVLLRAYILLLIFRSVTMYFLPLNPPMTSIIMPDPLLEIFASEQTLTKDLFFSGHTATAFLIYLSVQNKILRSLFLIFTILIACFVLLQHVHYTIDVIAAPVFAYAAYRLSLLIDEKLY